MQIRDVKCYVMEDKPETRRESSADRGSMAPVPRHSGCLPRPGSARRPDGTPSRDGPSQYRLVIDPDGRRPTPTRSWHGSIRDWMAGQAFLPVRPHAHWVTPSTGYVWQRLEAAQRFITRGGVARYVDPCCGTCRGARGPIYKLLGACRESVPAYCNVGGRTIDDLVENAVTRVNEEGFIGCKDHSYRGVKANGEMAVKLREALGDEIMLFHDPVESYTYEEAVKIGRIMEKCRYRWIEEPLQDYDILGLQKLCATLDLPVLIGVDRGHRGTAI